MTTPATPAQRIVLIGLDGATWTNLARWVELGVMPTLGSLLSRGAWGVLNSTIPALTPPAWASLITGTNPGQHGIYHFRHATAGDYYQRRLNNSTDLQAATLWQRLNRHGRRAGVINVPLSFPLQPLAGFITTDAFSPDTTHVQVEPPALAREFSDYHVDVTHYPTALPAATAYLPQMLAFVAENERVLVSQVDAALRAVAAQPVDLLLLGWMFTDRLGHFAWKYSDPAMAAQLTGGPDRQIAARVREAFGLLDRQLARLLTVAGERATVLVVSDHGFGPVPTSFFNTNHWLAARGYLRLLPPWHWQRAVLGNLPRSWRQRLHIPLDSKHGFVDWPHTRVWADPLESRAVGLYLHRRDRYPAGILDPQQAESLTREIIAELGGLRAPDGQLLFAAIHRAATLYHGPNAKLSPDLVGILAAPFDVPPSFRRDVRAGARLVPNRHILRDGGHEPEGIYLLAGHNVRPAGRLPPQPIESIVPTVLQLLGLPLDEDLDAPPITAALTPEFLQAFPTRHTAQPAAPPQPEYSAEDSAAVEERLRQLGYLD